MKVWLLDEAEQDIIGGFEFYEKQRAGLGDYFINALFADIDSLQLYAGIHQKYFSYHRLLAKRFPYAIYYRLSGNTVRVYAVLDCRQNPLRLRRRLRRIK